jgi:hypothetical protein
MARYDEVVLGKKNTPLTTQRVNPVTGMLEVAFNGAPTNPMAGGSEARPPSVAPTPTPAPTQEAVQATLPKGFTALPPNGKGEIKILDSTGKTTQMVDSRGIMWEIIYDQSGKPIGKRRVQQPNQ